MAISDRIEAIEQHLTNDYSVLTLAGADLTNVDKNIVNLKPTWKERLLYFMNNGTDVVWENWDKVTGEGTSISLNNTLEGKMKIDLKGNTSQEGTPTPETPQDIHVVSGDNSIVVCGKNIWHFSTKTEDGWYTDIPNFFTNTGTYTLSINNSSLSGNWSVYFVDSSKQRVGEFMKLASSVSTPSTFNVSQEQVNAPYIRVLPNATGLHDLNSYMIQVEKGSQATEYQEYEGTTYPISLSSKNLIPNEVVLPLGTYGGATVVTLLDFGEDKTFSNLTLSFNFKDAIYTNSSGAFIDFVKNDGTHQYNLAGSFGISPNVNINGTKYLKRTSETTFRKLNVYVSGYANFTQGFISEAMLVEGTQELPYEAHFSPIELCKIGDYQDKIDKSSGKNLLDTSSMVLGDLNNTTGAEETNTNKTHYRSDFIPVKPNTTYVFTTDYQVTGINKLMEYGSNKSFIIRNSQSSTNKTIMFTTSANTYYFRLCMYTSPAFTDFYSLHNMLNEGTTALPYEPYGTSWYLNKQIGKVVLDGSETWSSAGTSYYTSILQSLIAETPATSQQIGYSNYFKVVGFNYQSDNNLWFHPNKNLQMKNTNYPTLNDWKTWLSTNKPELIYPLATPTYTEITDSTLLSQLNALAKSYTGQTNISQNNNDMPSILNATALKEMA